MSSTDVNDWEYNKLFIVNESKDAKVTLHIYRPSLPISFTSKIIQPNEKYLYHEKKAFKYKLVAIFDGKQKKKEFPGPLELIGDTLIRITESLECIEENFDDYPQEKRICLRKMHLKNELPHTNGQLNLYSILDLNMEDVRKLKKDDQKKAIEKAFRSKIRIWHPDKNYGDWEIAVQIISAKETLVNDDRRARYHNEADYDKGWLSPKRYKAIFWPDCYSEDQNDAYWRRIGLAFVSLFGLALSGAVLTALTAGAAAPAAVVCGAIFGGGLAGSGFLSGMHTVSKNSVVNEFEAKSWLLKAGIGFLGGAVTGAVAVGITTGVVGIGSGALESGAVTLGQYAGIGAASGASGGAASSLASDVARKFVDGEDVTLKEFLGHAVAGAVIGAATGTLGGMVTKAVVNGQTTAGSVALEGEVVEQAVILPGAKRMLYPLTQSITRKLTESGTEAVMGTAADVIEERLDDSVENQNPIEHVKNRAMRVAGKTVISCSVDVGAACIKHAINEQKIMEEMKGKRFKTSDEKQKFRRIIRHKASVKENEHRINWYKARGCYKPIVETDKPREQISQSNRATGNVPEEEQDKKEEKEEEEDDGCNVTSEQGATQESQKATFRYISSGAWFSKMIVTFLFHGEEIKKEVSSSGEIVKVPADARQVKVRFQVSRPSWGDIMKYDRFKKIWCKHDRETDDDVMNPRCPFKGMREQCQKIRKRLEPQICEPHVFYYEKPPLERTFSISGNLWWEAVTRVSDENDEETGEGID